MEIYINTRGTRLSIDNGMLLVRNATEMQRIPMHSIRTLILSKGCTLSSDLIYQAIDHQIDILFGTRFGKPKGRIWSNQFGSIAQIRKMQLSFSQSAEAACWVGKLIARKIKNQSGVLSLLFKADKSTDDQILKAIHILDKYITKFGEGIQGSLSDNAEKFRGWEGICSKNYFECINLHLPQVYRFERRSQHPAMDMFNAMLNYAYGILYGKIESSLIKSGIDPYVGIFHRDEYNRPVFVYDVIEVFRYWADIVVINLCMQQIMFPEFFTIEKETWLLNSDGKRILIQSFNDYFEEIIRLNGLERSRLTHIDLYCQELARMFKEYKP